MAFVVEWNDNHEAFGSYYLAVVRSNELKNQGEHPKIVTKEKRTKGGEPTSNWSDYELGTKLRKEEADKMNKLINRFNISEKRCKKR